MKMWLVTFTDPERAALKFNQYHLHSSGVLEVWDDYGSGTSRRQFYPLGMWKMMEEVKK